MSQFPVLDANSKELDRFINLCAGIYLFDKNRFKQEAVQAIAYYKGSKINRGELRRYQELENKWYESLQQGKPDYSVYSNNDIIPDIWSCWAVYSRQYLLNITSPKSLDSKSIIDDMGKVRRVVDLGCGISYTTASLSRIFPAAQVIGTNVENSTQYKIGLRLSKIFGFKIVGSVQQIQNADVIFASEYFEHWEKPIDHLLDVLKLKPKALIIANAFSAKSLGHFNQYVFNGERYTGNEISKMFNNTLQENGFAKIKTNCWNNRPNYWKLV